MTRAHPHPTASTIKYLYAHAFSCAFPGCKRPLYQVDSETGQRTLCSRVAHICARSEGGPRWDLRQTAEENRSESNLLLMCVEHASAIDDPSLALSYNADRLRSLKREQLRRYDEIHQGWILTDNMVAKVTKDSFPGADLNFGSGSTISLGGQGGMAPGAGGGGGGAIGKGAKGGRGGDGGSSRVDDTEYTLPFEGDPEFSSFNEEHDPDLPPRPAPGAGGGGAGVVGDGAIAGHGGNGGNHVAGLYDLEAMRRDGFSGRIEIVVGEAGRMRLPNQLPQPGEDTIIRFMKEDGSILKEVRAEGGLAATPSLATLPDGWVELSSEEVSATNFRVISLMIATAADQQSGSLYILGGDWRYFRALNLPVDAIFNVVVSIRFDILISQAPTIIYLSLFDPTARETARAVLIIDPKICTHSMANFIVPIGSTIDLTGEWQVQVWSAGQIFSYIDVNVQDMGIAL